MFPNPSISAEAARRALGTGQVRAANQHDASDERAVLDEAELRDVERLEYYGGKPPAVEVGPPPVATEPVRIMAAPRRGFLDRLFGRRPG